MNAFIVFAAVYATKYPESGSALLAYMSNIRFLASSVDSLSWLHYDIDFKQARVTNAISWAAIDKDLWLKAMAVQRPFRKGGSQGTGQQGGMGSPETRVSGECWSKAKHGACTETYCHFKHTCPKCQRQHKGADCEYSRSSGINTETPKIANSS